MRPLDVLTFGAFALWQQRVMGLPPARVLALQQRRLRRLLHVAARRSAFYRRKFAGLDLARCPLDALPTTDKGELMAHFDAVVTDPRVRRADVEVFMDDADNAAHPYLGTYAVCSTSGSQGQPLIVLQDPRALRVLFALQLTRANVRRPGPAEALRRLRDPARLAVIAMRRGFYPSNAVWQHMPAPARAFVRLLRLTPTDPDLAEQLNAFRPHGLTAYASTLELLALQRHRLRLAPDLQQVVSNSEVLTDRAGAAFRDAFGVPVLNNYSLAECNHLSNGCRAGPGVHVNADWAILEVVDERNRPVPPGETGHKVLLTNLVNEVQPIIRYEVGDRVTVGAGPCGCPNRLPYLARIEGRTADFFWVRVGDGYRQILSFVFKTAFEMVPEVREWQAVQEDRNRIVARLELLPGATLDRGRPLRLLHDQLASLGLTGAVDVAVEFVPRLAPDAVTGKFRRVVSHVGPPADLAAAFRAAPDRPRADAAVEAVP